MRKPNFFILGAPKCGTTSLAAWLSRHPNIFVSEEKEPHFFNTDDRQHISSLAEYESLFLRASDRHKAVGEASVWYLSSAKAVENILRYQPRAKFIVMVRNPMEMAPALHSEMVLSGHEDIRDFRKAWDIQAERKEGRALPAFSWARRRFLYGEVCKLGSQLERLLSMVPAPRVHVVVLDELAAEPRQEYLRVLRFLGVEDDGRLQFPVYNSAKNIRWPRFTRIVFILGQIRRKAGMKTGLSLWKRFARLNQYEMPRTPLPRDMENLLRSYFLEDIRLLEHLCGKNFEHWLRS
ncbi:MAG TPA: sulfotransferase [Methylocella sp.]|nr:sulfotransferase [Methylocella sp.]